VCATGLRAGLVWFVVGNGIGLCLVVAVVDATILVNRITDVQRCLGVVYATDFEFTEKLCMYLCSGHRVHWTMHAPLLLDLVSGMRFWTTWLVTATYFLFFFCRSRFFLSASSRRPHLPPPYCFRCMLMDFGAGVIIEHYGVSTPFFPHLSTHTLSAILSASSSATPLMAFLNNSAFFVFLFALVNDVIVPMLMLGVLLLPFTSSVVIPP
jgi:hypothetical protein